MKAISWNLFRHHGASLADVACVVVRERPDILLMQETTDGFERLTGVLGGYYVRACLPGRVHGPACWSPRPVSVSVLTLRKGVFVRRVCQVIDVGAFRVANVHLSHGQVMNRRQLRQIAGAMGARAVVMGDCNMVGPALLYGFRDVGPRTSTHRMGHVVPLRLDRCLLRGVSCLESYTLPYGHSDHRPLVVRLAA